MNVRTPNSIDFIGAVAEDEIFRASRIFFDKPCFKLKQSPSDRDATDHLFADLAQPWARAQRISIEAISPSGEPYSRSTSSIGCPTRTDQRSECIPALDRQFSFPLDRTPRQVSETGNLL